MLYPDPFRLSESEMATAEAMRAAGTIPDDWRFIDISWLRADIFDKIVEIGGSDMQVLACAESEGRKRGELVFGPDASMRVNERAHEILGLFERAIHGCEADGDASKLAA
jgi:hypothetical protein